MRRICIPRAFRERHGEAMEAVFVEALDEAPTRAARWELWVRETVDLLETGRRLRRERRRHGAGFVARHTRSTTGGVGMRGFLDDARYAVRSLVRRPSLTGFAAVTVALGVGSATAIYSTLEGVVLRPVPYEHADRMVTLLRPIGNSGSMRTPATEQVEAWRAMDQVFERVETSALRTLTLTGMEEPEAVEAGLIGPGFHDLTGRVPVIGRAFTEDEVASDARIALLGHGLWVRRYGRDRGVLGSTLELDGEPRRLVGVMPPDTPYLGFDPREVDVWLPLPPGTATSAPVGLLREGVTLERANARLEAPVETSDGGSATGLARPVGSFAAERMSGTLRALMVAVFVLLLIATVNVSNLLIGRAAGRRHETAVCAAMGGGPLRLGRQMLVEGLALGSLGGAAGVGLAWLGLRTILSLRPPTLNALDSVALNGRVMLFTVAVTLAATLLFSLVPTWRATRSDALEPLRGGTRSGQEGRSRTRLHWALVTGEVALSFALVVATAVVLSAFTALRTTDPGFEASRVVAFRVVPGMWQFAEPADVAPVHEATLRGIRALPGVEAASLASGRPGAAGVFFGSVQVEGGEPSEETHVLHGPAVDGAYFGTLGQDVRHGRPFVEDDFAEGAEQVAVIGASTALRFFGTAEAAGRRLGLGGGEEDWWTVVGVTDDVPMTGLSSEAALQFYIPLPAEGWGADRTYLVRLAPGVELRDVVPAFRAMVLERFSDARVEDIATMEQHLAGTLARERFASTLLSLFTGLALALAAVGFYGVVSQLVGQRTREIGIRMALGADRHRIRGLVLRHGLVATGVGAVVGAGLAAMGEGLLASVLVGAGSAGAPAYGLALGTMLGLTLLATWVPARRAVRVDPVRAMRTE